MLPKAWSQCGLLLLLLLWRRFTGVWEAVAKLPLLQQYVLLCLPAIGQGHVLLLPPPGVWWCVC